MMYVKSNLKNRATRPNKRDSNRNGRKNSDHSATFDNEMAIHYMTGQSAAQAMKNRRSSAWKIILFSVFVGVLGLTYINHVFSMQQEYHEVIELQREYEKIKRIHSDHKFTYDRMIGPAEVYSRAKTLGLSDGGPSDGVVIIKK